MNLDKLEQLEKRATGGPWKWEYSVSSNPQSIPSCGVRSQNGWVNLDNEATGKLVSELRNAAPALLRIARAANIISHPCPESENHLGTVVKPTVCAKAWNDIIEALKELEQ